MAANQFLSLPDVTNGLSPASPATAWGIGSWVQAIVALPIGIKVIGFQFQLTYPSGALDTTFELLFEVGIGNSGSEVIKIQIPSSQRLDTTIGYYQQDSIYFSEPLIIIGGARVAVRVTDSIAAIVTYQGVKLLYEELKPPTVTLQLPTDAAINQSVTPQLDFTGTDLDGDAVEYLVEIDPLNTFTSGFYETFQNLGSGKEVGFTGVNYYFCALSSTRVVVTSYESLLFAIWDFNGAAWVRFSNDFAISSTPRNICALTSTSVVIFTTVNTLEAWDFNGVDWVKIGNAFSITGNPVTTTKLSSNVIACYSTSSQNLFCLTFDGTTFSQVGNSLNIGVVDYLTSLSSNRVATATTTTLDAYDFDGTNWIKVGSTFTIDLRVNFTHSITTMSSSTIAVYDGYNQSLKTYRFDGSVWTIVGDTTAGGYSDKTKIVGLTNRTLAQFTPNGSLFAFEYKPIALISAISTINAGFTAGHPYASGVQKSYTVQTALSNNTTHYWRVRAIDSTSSNTYGAWSTTRSFTTIIGTIVYNGILKMWNGTAWVKTKLKRWDGTTWVTTRLRRWDGTNWKDTDTTGI